jgi:hypothetical protein
MTYREGRYSRCLRWSKRVVEAADLADGRVSFLWKDYRHHDKRKVMTLDADEFIRRFLLHVLPDGFHRIRHYGYLANGGRVAKLAYCRRLLAAPEPAPPAVAANYRERYERLADETGLTLIIRYLPPGTSKWNRIEHRLFSFITGNWRGQPLLTHQVIIELTAATRTDTGLTVRCRLDETTYPKGVSVSDDELAAVDITRCDFHGEWNYAIAPRSIKSFKPSLTESQS